MLFLLALVVTLMTVVAGLVLLHASPGVAAVAFGVVAVISGAMLGYFADRLPEFRRARR
jgi:hypothetical protein